MTLKNSITKVVFMGSPDLAGTILKVLLEYKNLVEVTGVVTQPDKPAGRGKKITPPPVKIIAQQHNLPVLQPIKMKTTETSAQIQALSPELIIVAAYGRILPTSILNLPSLGCINVHASLLPRFRGASPIAHTILHGDTEGGVSIMHMDEGLDTGPVYAMRAIKIDENETGHTLAEKLAKLGADLLIEVLPKIISKQLLPSPQAIEGVSYAKLLNKNDGWLDFTKDANELARQVRALIPWPLAFITRKNERIQVLAAHALDGQGETGHVVAANSAGVAVACKRGVLVLDTVKPAGKSAMSAASWVAGRAIAIGDAFNLSSNQVPDTAHAGKR
ncbi:MAG: methionyl-tRNA formyltransferase [Deltaproteobacteria bacterium]|nr:methionyl-tRNA formyltransferase [Deltaproteobacteria bacterium]